MRGAQCLKRIDLLVGGRILNRGERKTQPAFSSLSGKAGAAGITAAQKKVVIIKPQPEDVIEINPETAEETIKDKAEIRLATPRGLSKKKTAVLFARSKAACGVTNKPKDLGVTNKLKDLIVNINAAAVENQLAAVQYVEDLYKFYKLMEGSSVVHYYMDSQLDMNEKMRAVLMDWLIEVHKFSPTAIDLLF